MLRSLHAIFIILFITISDPACAQWIESEDLAILKIKYELRKNPDYQKRFSEEQHLYSSIIKRISSQTDIDNELGGVWKAEYTCSIEHLEEIRGYPNCDKMYEVPTITVEFNRQDPWYTFSKQNNSSGYFTARSFKPLSINIGKSELEAVLSIDSPISNLSFRVDGRIRTLFGVMQPEVSGTCEKIDDLDKVVCLGNSKIISNMDYVNIFEKVTNSH